MPKFNAAKRKRSKVRPRQIPTAQLLEQLFNKLKNWRRVAARYDKTRESYLDFVSLASALFWLPFVPRSLAGITLIANYMEWQVLRHVAWVATLVLEGMRWYMMHRLPRGRRYDSWRFK